LQSILRLEALFCGQFLVYVDQICQLLLAIHQRSLQILFALFQGSYLAFLMLYL